MEALSRSFQRKKFLQEMPFSRDFQVTFLIGCHQASELQDLQVTPGSRGLPAINLVFIMSSPQLILNIIIENAYPK